MNTETKNGSEAQPAAVLYYCPQMEALAHSICEANPRIKLAHISWKSFSDGMPNISIHKVEGGRKMHAAYLASFDSQEEFFRQLSVILWLPDYGSKGLKVLMPFFPGQMDRADTQSRVVTAKTFAMLLSAAPIASGSSVEYVFYDIHSLHSLNYFNKQFVRTRLKTATKYFKRAIDNQDIDICFPDKGGFTRFRPFFDGSRPGDRRFNIGYCDKDRTSADGRSVFIKEGNFAGRHVVIVDDIVQGGGTIIECKKALMAAGAREVSAFASHWVCPNDSWKRFQDAGFANVWLTDSFPKTAAKVAGIEPFRVISLAQSLSRVILDEDDEADEYELP